MALDRTATFRTNLLFLIVAIIAAYYFSELRLTMNVVYEKATPAQLVAGTAETPYQLRVLLPWLVGGMVRLGLPETAVTGAFQVLEFFSLLGLVVAFRAYLGLFFSHLLLASVLAFTIFFVLPFNLLYTYWYPYDVPAVLFFTLGLIALYRRAWGWYYLLFVVATLNRETTLFLTFLFVVTGWGKLPLKRLAGHTAVQLIIWVGIRTAVQSIYADNPGEGAFQLTLADNLQFLLQPAGWLWLLPTWGFTWIVALIGYRHLTDLFVRRSLGVVLPLFGVMLVVGKIDELRIYADLTPVVLAAALLSLQWLFERQALLQPAQDAQDAQEK